MHISITKTAHPGKLPPADRIGFGSVFTDHMFLMDYTDREGWHNARIVPFGPISISPAASVLHYGTEVFEGLKAYRRADGGIQTFRSSIVATPKAEGSKATVSCQSLMLDDQSRSDTIPAMDIRAKNVDIGHEATIGRIGDDKVFYLMSRGISEEEARTMIVNGFANPVSKELPLEYAVEMNNLIKLEMEGAIG